MLRKVRVEGPRDRLAQLLAAAHGAAVEVDDWAIDTSADYGWPALGNGRAYVLAVVDDDACTAAEVAALIAEAHRRATGEDAGWVAAGGSYVWLPDGLEPEWYETVLPYAEALHAAEFVGDESRAAVLREWVCRAVSEALPASEKATLRFDRAVERLGEAGPLR